MAVATYELRLSKEGRAVHQVPPFTAALDVDEPAALQDLLTRHLVGAVDRASDRRENAHLYRLDVHKTDGQHHGYGQPVIRFSLPIAMLP